MTPMPAPDGLQTSRFIQDVSSGRVALGVRNPSEPHFDAVGCARWRLLIHSCYQEGSVELSSHVERRHLIDSCGRVAIADSDPGSCAT